MTYGPDLKWQIPHLNKCCNRATNYRVFLVLLTIIFIIFIAFSYYPSFNKDDTSFVIGEQFTAVNNVKNRKDIGNALGNIARGFNKEESKDRVQLKVKDAIVTKVGEKDSVPKEKIHYKRGKELITDYVDKNGDLDIDVNNKQHIEILEDEDDVDDEISEENEVVEEGEDEIDDGDAADNEEDDSAEDLDNEGDNVTPDDVDNEGDNVTPDDVDNVTTNSVILPSGSPDQFHWNDSRLDILHMPEPPFDSNFQNPCWYESLDSPDPYKDNIYATFSRSANQVLERLTDKWKGVYQEEEPKRLRCLPYFLIIGQPKCGSTDLFWKIAKHPDVDTPPIKELHWWSRSRQGRRLSYSKIIPISDYVDMFDQAAVRIAERVSNNSHNHDNRNHGTSQIITGEASVSLFWDNSDWSKFPENWGLQEPLYIIPHYISHLLPKVKLIIVLREPAERLYSDYLYFSVVNKSADHFHSLVQDAINVYTSCIRLHQLRECVYNRSVAYKVKVRLRIGMYSVYMDDWLKEFSREQFYVYRLEDYSQNPLETIREIYSFLGIRKLTSVEEQAVLASTTSNARSPKHKRLGSMHEKTRRLLNNFYKPYNRKLAETLRHKKYLWEDYM